MGSQANQLHFILFPFLAQGHLIPMVDIAKLLALQGAIVTIFTTPVNAARFKNILARAISSGLQIRLNELEFPTQKAGLPDGCENLDMIPSMDLIINFCNALTMLQLPAEKLLEQISPPPSCIISDMCFPWTTETASKFNVPRIAFHGFSCFCLLCWHILRSSKIHENVSAESEYFIIPGLPDKIEITKAQLPMVLSGAMKDFGDKLLAAEQISYGVIINTFEELEAGYVKEFKKVKGGKVWCVGPVSLCNKDTIDKVERGNKASIDESECLKWLDSRQPSSVLYVCLGSLCNLTTLQQIELGLGLEASKKPFIWVIRGKNNTSEELEKWFLEQNFEERIKERGLLIRGWAPQVLLLSHTSIGGFLTHCGWNSSVEGISAGLSMLTWPLFSDQFCNEKLIVHVLKIGVRIGVESPLTHGEEEKIGVLVKKEDVEKAVHELMDDGEERDERRRRAKELGVIANTATEKGGSSYNNIELLIQDIMIMQQSLSGGDQLNKCD
ncbi:hypothetical protein Dsin_006514 [Dipteronia sinensis]|uniref:Glycosyltransferase N-terminal domain-containing protein n=1 Tax=Dipteronia sinensis TaxID=43782 RepID=A0AAE0AYV8_9ROSI|nr:hypothetical protein Dsin_006514 [Dipteronia sinensis]